MRILTFLVTLITSKSILAKEPYDWQLGFQEPASEVMRSVLELHNFVLIMMTAITIFVLLLILYVVFRFRKNANPNPSKRSHNTLIEILWTGIPVIILVAMAIPSFKLVYQQDIIPEADMTVKVVGHQWYWEYQYPEHFDITFESYMIPDEELEEGDVLEAHKLYVFDAERLKVHGGILRVYVSLNKKPITKKLKKILRKENDKNIITKISNLNSFRIKFNNKVKRLLINLKRQNKITYGMGAAPRACVMLNSCNLTKNEIGLVGEVAQSLKCNKYIPGTDIMVKDENKIITDKPDYVIILAWHLTKRIISLLLKKGYKGDFITPLPKLKILKN